MPLWITAVLVSCLLTAATTRCYGEESEDHPDSLITREQWQQRVDEARRRSQEFVASARTRTAVPPYQEEVEAAARAMRDPTLRQGDIVATRKGLFVFVGRDEEHQPGDFVSAPRWPPP